jgi:hypothetical protein
MHEANTPPDALNATVFTIEGADHRVGDAECAGCTRPGYPEKHQCGGLVHTTFGGYTGDEGSASGKWWAVRCDRCGWSNAQWCESLPRRNWE